MTPTDYLKRPYARTVVPETDGTFRAEILEFPGCIASGDTAAEAFAALEDVAESWLASMLARSQPIPEPLEANDYSGKLVLRLSKSVHRKAALAARFDNVSLNYFIANLVSEAVGVRTAAPVAVQTDPTLGSLWLQIGWDQMAGPWSRTTLPVSSGASKALSFHTLQRADDARS